MAIRVKNLDLATAGMKRSAQTDLGDITATISKQIFVAPTACVINNIDFYANNMVGGNGGSTGSSVSSINFCATIAAMVNGSANTIATHTTSGTSITSDAFSANERWRTTPSSNNSLTQGSVVRMIFSVTGSCALSATIVAVTYTPLIHRETR